MNAGRALVLLLILVGAAGAAISGAAFYYHLLYLGLILAAVAWLSVRWVARGLRLTRRPDFTRASVGDIYKEQFEVRNTSRIPGGWVELHNEMPLPLAAGSRLLTRLQPAREADLRGANLADAARWLPHGPDAPRGRRRAGPVSRRTLLPGGAHADRAADGVSASGCACSLPDSCPAGR